MPICVMPVTLAKESLVRCYEMEGDEHVVIHDTTNLFCDRDLMEVSHASNNLLAAILLLPLSCSLFLF